MIFERVFKEYAENIKVAIAFALLALIVPVFSYFENISIASGSMFWEYSTGFEQINLLTSLIAFLIFTWFYSLFVSAIILSVRRNLSKIRMDFYLTEMIQKFTMKLFIFYTVLGLILILGGTVLITSGLDPVVVNALILIAASVLMFVPQALVVDETHIMNAVKESFDFFTKNFNKTVLVLFSGAVILAVIGIIEYFLDLTAIEFFGGRFISLILVLVFAIPFIETLKTYLYMLKINLIKGFESAHHKK